MIGSINCNYCGAPITSHHGHYRAKRRGYGYCSQACDAAKKTERAQADISMRLMKRIAIGSDEECWPYRGRRTEFGHGCIDWNGRPWGAHQIMYMIIYGQIPKGMCVCHTCDNPICCNPGHLWLGSPSDNSRDMWDKGRGRVKSFRGETHGMAKLTEADVLSIRGSVDSDTELAKRHDVCALTIRNVRTRRSWAHV